MGTMFKVRSFLSVYKRQGAVKVMGGWSWDDHRMPMDEKKTWGTYGIYFGGDLLSLGKRRLKHEVDQFT